MKPDALPSWLALARAGSQKKTQTQIEIIL